MMCNPHKVMLVQVFIQTRFLWVEHLEPEKENKIATDMQISGVSVSVVFRGA